MKPSFNRLLSSRWICRTLRFGCVLLSLGSVGCAAENTITRGPNFSLNHPAFWEVKQVAAKSGDATKLSIGRFSETAIDEGVGADGSAIYEASQALVDARIFTWRAIDDGGDPTAKVIHLIAPVADLEMSKQGRIATDKGECGSEFTKKYLWRDQTLEPFDLLSRPGFRTIVVGAKSEGVLLGVLTKVPYEQDPGLFCHNLRNMQTQLQLLLDGLTVNADDRLAPAASSAPAAAAPSFPTASGTIARGSMTRQPRCFRI